MLIDQIHHWASLDPERIAAMQDDRRISYGALAGQIDRTVRFLLQQDLPDGGLAVVAIADMFQAWVAALALRTVGLDTIAIVRSELIDELDLRGAWRLVMLEHVRGHQRRGSELPASLLLPASLAAEAEGIAAPVRLTRPAGGHILYTSGTTGRYKKVLLDAAGEDTRNARRAADLNISRDARFYGANFGLWTGAGYKQPSAVWHVGGAIRFDQRSDFITHVFDHEVTGMSLLPAMYRKLISLPEMAADAPRFAHVDLFASSGFLPLNSAQGLVRQISPRLELIYSATELVRIPLRAAFRSSDDLAWLSPTADAGAEIVDEDGRPCAIGEEGNLRIASTKIDSHLYLDDPETSATVFRDGFFHPGDRALRGADGRIRILGRVADVINLRGQKVAAAPLEQQVQRMLDAEEVCLFSHMDDAGRDQVLAAVESPHALRPEQAQAVAKLLGGNVSFIRFDQFPRTRMGTEKVRRIELKTMAIHRLRG